MFTYNKSKMNDIDINARLKELDYYQNITNNLASKFNDWMKTHELNNTQKAHETERSCFIRHGKDVEQYSSIWLHPRSEKLKIYEEAVNSGGNLTEPEMTITFNDGMESLTCQNDNERTRGRTFAEITRFKRDIKRKKMKYRTTKAPPLTHTEEIRSLISLQMESWEQYCNQSKRS